MLLIALILQMFAGILPIIILSFLHVIQISLSLSSTHTFPRNGILCIFLIEFLILFFSTCDILLSLISQNGNSALIEAAKAGKTDIVVELVKAGANLDLQNKVCPVMNTGTQDGLPLGTSSWC